MRIRTFTAESTPAAIALVRCEMGPDAVIIAMDPAANGRGIVVRAAIDQADAGALQRPGEQPAPSIEARLEALLTERLKPTFRGAHKTAA